MNYLNILTDLNLNLILLFFNLEPCPWVEHGITDLQSAALTNLANMAYKARYPSCRMQLLAGTR